MPHFGQLPGSLRTISGCMGQVNSTLVDAALGASSSSAIPHFGHGAGSGDRTSGCIGQV
jgi:hypothetical protein